MSSADTILKNAGNQTASGPQLTSIFYFIFSSIWKSMGNSNCLVNHIFKHVFFYVPQKKETHTGLAKLKGK